MLTNLRTLLSCYILSAFLITNVFGTSPAQEPVGNMLAGHMVGLSAPARPVLFRGIQFNPTEPLAVDFLVDAGDSVTANTEAFQVETEQLAKYFLTGLTVPRGELWVNLSPYEGDRIIPEGLGQTELGKVFLEEDYLLKNLTASLIHPESDMGRRFWTEIYKQSLAKFGTTEIPVDTFNKVWIVPERPVVYERPADAGAGQVAFVVEAKLKVMLETDYVAAKAAGLDTATAAGLSQESRRGSGGQADSTGVPEPKDAQELSKQILREIIIPVLEQEVNTGANFARLRQVYHALILAGWMKRKILASTERALVDAQPGKGSGARTAGQELMDSYVDRNKIAGVENGEKDLKARVWDAYVAAFRKGVFNFIREEKDPLTDDLIPRKYFSGGFDMAEATDARITGTIDRASLPSVRQVSFRWEPLSTTRLVDNVRRALSSQNELTVTSAVLALSVMAAVVDDDRGYFYRPLNRTQAAARMEEIAGRFWAKFEQDQTAVGRTMESLPQTIHRAFRPAGLMLALWIAGELSPNTDLAMRNVMQTTQDQGGNFSISLPKGMLTPELEQRILDVVSGRNREGVLAYGRTFDVILPKPIILDGKKVNRLRIKGAYNSAPVPYDDSGSRIIQSSVRITVRPEGVVAVQQRAPSPQGTMLWPNVMREYTGMQKAFAAGVPTGNPIGYGRWSWAYGGNPVGFVITAEEGLRENLMDLLERHLQSLLKPGGRARRLEQVLSRTNGLVGEASTVLRQMHRGGVAHGQAKLHQFSRSAGKVRIYDFETSILAADLSRQEFDFRVLKDVGDFLVDLISSPLAEMFFETFYNNYIGDGQYNPRQMLAFVRAYRQFSQRLEAEQQVPLTDFLQTMAQEPFAQKILNLPRDYAMLPDIANKMLEERRRQANPQNGGIDLNAAMYPETRGVDGNTTNGNAGISGEGRTREPRTGYADLRGLSPVLIGIRPLDDLPQLLGLTASEPH